jgi:hypothetical protein
MADLVLWRISKADVSAILLETALFGMYITTLLLRFFFRG